jgi:methionyl-tRNA formyltransferase
MKLIFAGTPLFAATALDALIAAGFEIALVLTQPDRPSGRGMRLKSSPVKERAQAHGLPLEQPATLKSPEVQQKLTAAGAQAMVVAAYGLLLPPAVLAIPTLGCLNIHASLLPRWRGAAPIQRALLAGDSETGITIMEMEAGLDTGPIVLQEKIAISDHDTAQSLELKLARLGAHCIVNALLHRPPSRPQDETHATYALKVAKSEARIDWSQPAPVICREVRAFNPTPGTSATLSGIPVKIWQAEPTESLAASPGTIVSANSQGIVVAAGEGAVRLLELQRAGGKRLSAQAFAAGAALIPSSQLTN